MTKEVAAPGPADPVDGGPSGSPDAQGRYPCGCLLVRGFKGHPTVELCARHLNGVASRMAESVRRQAR